MRLTATFKGEIRAHAHDLAYIFGKDLDQATVSMIDVYPGLADLSIGQLKTLHAVIADGVGSGQKQLAWHIEGYDA